MSYVQKCLQQNEHVVYAATLHWIIYTQGIMFAVLGAVFGYEMPSLINRLFDQPMAGELMHPAAIVCFIISSIGAIMLLGAYIRQVSTELVVTNQRIIAKYGYISRSTFEIMISRVTGANFEQTIRGRLLGYGTILVHGAGGDISPIDLIADPQGFQNALMGVLERAPPRPPGAPAGPAR
jgi:uncharacterized membrane protein YdbT with pleckstrin-like domain